MFSNSFSTIKQSGTMHEDYTVYPKHVTVTTLFNRYLGLFADHVPELTGN